MITSNYRKPTHCSISADLLYTASIFSRDDERVIGKGIIAKCQEDRREPSVEGNRLAAAKGIVDMAETTIGSITKFQWDIAVIRIGQLASEMNVSMGGQFVGLII